MPRFHFNVHDGKTVFDKVGTELDDLDHAREEAVAVAGRIIQENSKHVCNCEEWRLEVTDDDGLTLILLEFHMFEAPALMALHLDKQNRRCT